MKIDTGVIIRKYDANLSGYTELANIVQYTLKKSIKKHGIKTHSITFRIKGINSLIDKVRRKRINKPFEQIHDLVGFRVVCLFLSDLDEVRNILRGEFDVFEEDDKINDSEINIFGYMSLHLKARLKHPSDATSTHEIGKIPFEIQVRTIAQDAWASISHYLDYKQTSVIPEELKRDFHALSGLFYVADTHFLILKKEQSKMTARKSIK
jgi:ppGpp synthetase/RelA/SpoT-type nucleotidyltranferase